MPSVVIVGPVVAAGVAKFIVDVLVVAVDGSVVVLLGGAVV